MKLFALYISYSDTETLDSDIEISESNSKILVLADDEVEARTLASIDDVSSHGTKWFDKSITRCEEIQLVKQVIDY